MSRTTSAIIDRCLIYGMVGAGIVITILTVALGVALRAN